MHLYTIHKLSTGAPSTCRFRYNSRLPVHCACLGEQKLYSRNTYSEVCWLLPLAIRCTFDDGKLDTKLSYECVRSFTKRLCDVRDFANPLFFITCKRIMLLYIDAIQDDVGDVRRKWTRVVGWSLMWKQKDKVFFELICMKESIVNTK